MAIPGISEEEFQYFSGKFNENKYRDRFRLNDKRLEQSFAFADRVFVAISNISLIASVGQ